MTRNRGLVFCNSFPEFIPYKLSTGGELAKIGKRILGKKPFFRELGMRTTF
jgi:hypothetical protein